MRRTWSTFLVLFVFAIAPPAFAQLELGIDGGLMDFGNALVDDEGPRISVRAAWYLNDYFALEGQISHAEADAFDTELDTYTVNGVVSFRHDKVVQPYVMAGIGFSEAEKSGFELDGVPTFKADDDGQATVGAIGIKSFFGGQQHYGLRIETGFVWTDLFNQSTTSISWSAGFIYRF